MEKLKFGLLIKGIYLFAVIIICPKALGEDKFGSSFRQDERITQSIKSSDLKSHFSFPSKLNGKIKIITIDSNGQVFSPIPVLEEDDIIYFAIVNLKQEDLSDLYEVNYTTKSFDSVNNRINGLGKIIPSEGVKTKGADLYTLLLPLGEFRGVAPWGSGGIMVDYEIWRCKLANDVSSCTIFSGKKLDKSGLNAASVQDSDTTKEKAKNDEIYSSSSLKIYNTYRFSFNGGFAYSMVNKNWEVGDNINPVIGLSCYLEKRNPDNPISLLDIATKKASASESLGLFSIWTGLGFSSNKSAWDNFYIGVGTQIADGMDLTVGENFRKIDDKNIGKNAKDNLRGALFIGLTYDFDIFKETFLNVIQNPKNYGISSSK